MGGGVVEGCGQGVEERKTQTCLICGLDRVFTSNSCKYTHTETSHTYSTHTKKTTRESVVSSVSSTGGQRRPNAMGSTDGRVLSHRIAATALGGPAAGGRLGVHLRTDDRSSFVSQMIMKFELSPAMPFGMKIMYILSSLKCTCCCCDVSDATMYFDPLGWSERKSNSTFGVRSATLTVICQVVSTLQPTAVTNVVSKYVQRHQLQTKTDSSLSLIYDRVCSSGF